MVIIVTVVDIFLQMRIVIAYGCFLHHVRGMLAFSTLKRFASCQCYLTYRVILAGIKNRFYGASNSVLADERLVSLVTEELLNSWAHAEPYSHSDQASLMHYKSADAQHQEIDKRTDKLSTAVRTHYDVINLSMMVSLM